MSPYYPILPTRTLNRNTFSYGKPAPIVFELHWTPVHADPLAMVFIRNIPGHADIIGKYRLDSAALLQELMQ